MSNPDPKLLAEIGVNLGAIEASAAADAGPRWGAMHKLLLKAKVDGRSLLGVIGNRDLAELRNVVARLRGETVVSAPVAEAPPVAEFDPTLLQTALKTFRRRIKFSRLDSESRLGVGPLSGGANHRIESMIPPKEYPTAVWDALVRAGKLRREGDGFYSLTDDNSQKHW